MTYSLRTGTVAALVATALLTSGCGGGPADKLAAARSAVAGDAAAASSAEAAIAALGSKLAALTSTTPAAPTSAAPTSAAPTSAAPTSAGPAGAAASSGGLPVVPSGAALSSLLGTSVTPSAAPPAAPVSGNLSGALASANALLGGALSQLDVSKQCAMIPTADVQALVKKPIGTAHNEPEQCGWTGTDLDITINLNDVDKHDYTNLAGGGHAIAGLGDVAEWSSPGGAVVDVNAHKGKVTCYIEGAQDIPDTTEPFTGKDPFYTIKPADQLAYATKEAKLCADVFTITT